MQLPEGLEWHRASKIPETIHWSLFIPVVVWNFSGFESAGNVIEEVSNPNKTFVRALILMIIAALLTYIPPILVGVSASALWNTPFEAWDVGFWVRVAGAVGGYNVAVFMMIGGAVSTFGLMVTQLATTSRSLAGIGSLNAFPLISKWLSQYSPKWGTPVNAIVANTLVTSIISSCFTFNILVQVDQIFYSLRVLSILSAFLKLRASHPTLERPYRVPGGAVGAAICGVIPMIFSIAIVLTLMFSGFDILLTTVLAICGTVIVAFVWTRHFRPCGFDGSLVEVVEDGELQAYGSLR
uniref:Putative amino acid transporter n=1 Tax=Trypanosoma congolense (strain IL3000) TaxID=1068625 RepID=G0UUC6_TRYCI|nr:putative amino acid transporter [Trypanosoma congolense IL3000]